MAAPESSTLEEDWGADGKTSLLTSWLELEDGEERGVMREGVMAAPRLSALEEGGDAD